ncbi:hypothetical protein CRG98_002281 [Punica granatum]|uniref:Uncharacterized protein n=1 Tax=Punica granatum TaxID=22663 RepID=A0A2I0LAY1_PUNGR|nr:hypothetical protein CRG98_002281 [Punica granatum]
MAIVTGALRGIGRAIAVHLHSLVAKHEYRNLADTTLKDRDRTFNVNTRGAVLYSKEARVLSWG